ncbi:MAG TPA: tetratricopeptide repeat protein [Methylocystis sp.]|nr:tetratricopeptide repeat protein [Methylocystis sp.]
MSEPERSPSPSSPPEPDATEEKFKRATARLQQGDLAQAERIYEQILERAANHVEALHFLGVVKARTGRPQLGLELIDKAIALRPAYAEFYSNRGNVLKQLGHLEQALSSYDQTIALKPDYAGAYCNRGLVLQELGRLEEALENYDRAIALRPQFAQAHRNRERVLQALQLSDGSTRPQASPSDATDAGATKQKLDRALVCHQQGDRAQAESLYSAVLEQSANNLRALHLLGILKVQAGEPELGLTLFDKAIALKPDFAEAHNNRGNALKALKRHEEALSSYDRAIGLKPDYAMAHSNRGGLLAELKRLEEAAQSYERAIALNPHEKWAFGGLAACLGRMCDWDKRPFIVERLKDAIAAGDLAIEPFLTLGYLDDPALLRACSEKFVKSEIGEAPPPLRRGESWRNEKIRVAFLSADFRDHPMAVLITEALERLDRARFEVIGISFGPDDGSEWRARLVSAFDRFIDVRLESNAEIATLVADLKVDIAVDLMGYTRYCRPEALARRPAPIQVNYLGFVGTMGADFIDYIIADEIVLPLEQQLFYSEKIVHLPGCYLPNDRGRKISETTPAKKDVGLPEYGFVFCCFNNNWKITPEAFDVWMRILRAVDDSVLWLLRDNETAERNLRKEAQARGVDPSRLIFAPRADLPDHLARHRLADLFLDTLPYNAHTTASDALWVGLPVLTSTGKSFAGRVATSLLHAIELPELATASLADYETLALALARDPARLAEIKARLARNRDALPLFDSDRFCRGLEAAFVHMRELWQSGKKPESFAVGSASRAAP